MSWLSTWVKYITRMRLAPYVPSPPIVGETMLKLARVQPGEVLVDLGCGDGRLLRQAVDAGATRAIGYELDADLVATARTAAADDERIVVHQADVLSAADCIRQADVVALYLTERGNAAVLPMLREHLKPHSRVVSYVWPMPGIEPTATATATGPGVVLKIGSGNVLLWDQADLVRVMNGS